MNTKMKFLGALAAIVLLVPSCTKLNKGDCFTQTVNGVVYEFEVIVSKMRYVKIRPVSDSRVVAGEVVIPAAGEFDGDKYLVTQIAEEAFKEYEGITSVVLPETLSQIEDEAFAGCVNLKSINTPQPLSVIGDYAFEGCHLLQEFSLEASISELGEGAFKDCSLLQELNFTPTFSAIPDELCMGCTSLTELELPSTILTVGDSAFEYCIAVQSITMDHSVKSLGARAFYKCESVSEITCLTSTPPSCTEDTFAYVPPTAALTVPAANVNDYANATGWSKFTNVTGVNK